MLLIAGATLLISAFSAGLIRAQTCIQPPTCEELGYIYSADECVNGNNILKCPTDLSKMACSFDAIGNDGDILYADHSTSSEVINAKTPIAVIFDAGNRLAVSLEAKIYQKETALSGERKAIFLDWLIVRTLIVKIAVLQIQI